MQYITQKGYAALQTVLPQSGWCAEKLTGIAFEEEKIEAETKIQTVETAEKE